MASKKKHAARSRKTAKFRFQAGCRFKNYRLTREERLMMRYGRMY